MCFRHSRTLLSSTPKIAAALRFPFSSVHRITSRLNFAIYDSLLGFRHSSSVTTVHDKLEKAPPTFQQPRVWTHILLDGAERPAACDLNSWKQISQNTSAAGGNNLSLRAAQLYVCLYPKGKAHTSPHRTKISLSLSLSLSLMPTSDPYDAKQLTHLH
jgi:hypothetical protein